MLLGQIKARKDALSLSEKAYKVAQGVDTVESLQDFYAETFAKDDHQHDDGLVPVDTDLEYIVSKSYKPGGIYWRLNFLNKSLGPLRDGDFGFVFKRPETGGTAFCASEASYFLDQTNRHIVWINNEGENEKVILRVYQAFFGATLEQVMSNIKRYNEEFKARTNHRFLFFGLDRSNKKDIEAIVDKYNPAVVWYDQLSKIKGFQNDREDLRLGSIFQWARDLANGRHAAIGIHQADGTAEGVRYLTMEHCANAKTAIQAEADWILGLGKSHDTTEENIRFLSISKNKLLGDPEVIPSLRHGRGEVILNTQIMRFEDIVHYG